MTIAFLIDKSLAKTKIKRHSRVTVGVSRETNFEKIITMNCRHNESVDIINMIFQGS